jgi:hypothetical protein
MGLENGGEKGIELRNCSWDWTRLSWGVVKPNSRVGAISEESPEREMSEELALVPWAH